MPDLPTCRRATWADVDRWAETLVGRVLAAGPAPEAVVGLTRGGWVPARLVADRLAVKRLASLPTSHWGVTATPDGEARVTGGLSGPVEGLRTLVVDDITDTGASLRLATEHVRLHGRPASLATGTFLHLAHSTFVPTFFAEEIPADRWAWVVFPWTYWEDLRTLAAKARPEGDGSAEGTARVLADRCHLVVPPGDVERALRAGPPRP